MSDEVLDLTSIARTSGESLNDLSAVRRLADGPPKAPERPLTPRELTLSINYVDPEGRAHNGTIISRVPDADDQQAISKVMMGLAAGALLPGQSFDQLPFMEQVRIRSWANCTVQLREVPKALQKWITQDPALWGSLADECEAHSARYFRRDTGEGAEGATPARVRVAPVDASKATRE